uniref:Microtubule-associated protein futsch n=1 Tax=Ascaris suum TaxID=6253 RepID=F1KSR7_ASCSU
MAGDADLVAMLPAGHSVGSIRSRRPVVYIFTGGNEDAALFTVNGFSLLLDGGDQQQIPYWNLIRNYDKVSAVVATRMSPPSLTGISTIFARKLQDECHPTIGAFIGNLPPRSVAAGESDIARMVKKIYDGLHAEGVKASEALATPKMEPITLYEVIGEGALRMIVLNPERGSKELGALANAIKSNENIEKYAAATSLAALFVWHPADTNKPTIRILYPGACPLEKLYTALEKLKGEEYLRHVEYAFADRDKYTSTISANNRGVHPPTIASKLANQKSPSAPRPPTAVTATTTAPSNAATKKPAKPPSAPISSRPPARTSLATHTSTSSKTTKTVVETAAKKVVKQPLAGAALSRMSGTAAKKTSPTKPTAGGAKPTPDAKPAPIRKPSGPTNGAKTKEESKKEKPTTPEPAPASLAAPADDSSKPAENAVSPQNDVQPQPDVEHEPKKQPQPPESEKSITPPPVEKQSTPPPPAQNLDENGLLDGIEEPMKLRKVSMDTGKELDAEDTAILNAAEEAQHETIDNAQSSNLLDMSAQGDEDGAEEDGVAHGDEGDARGDENGADGDEGGDAGDAHRDEDGAHHIPEVIEGAEQDVPLLDSTPDMPLAPHIPAEHSPALQQEHGGVPQTGERLGVSPVTEQHSHIDELLESGACPFTAGLVSAIVDDASADSALRKMSAPPAMDVLKGDAADMSPSQPKQTDIDIKLANGDAARTSPHLTQRSVPAASLPDSLTSPASGDSVNAQPDAALDDVIESLAGESEREDHPKEMISPVNEHEEKQQNGGPDHMAAQHAMEDEDAQVLYMPPVTGGPRMRAATTRPSFGGAVSKPKISQPLYFDVVFVPHHGAHPALVDEAAAKAFAISVRSKRYVLSGKESIKPYILDGFVAAKTVWNKPELEIDVVPTHDSDDLRAYNQLKAGEMSEAGINLRCSVERCTLRLSSGNSDDVCAAFKFEM